MPKQDKLNPIVMQNRRLLFRNFSGAAGRYNAEGDRNFNVVLEAEEAESLLRDGWNVKYLKPRDPQEPPLARLDVAVAFGKIPPLIVLISSKGKTTLPEELISLLDYVEFDNVDLVVRPYEWTVNDKTGVKAYLKSIYCTLHEDELELKYADVPEYPLPDSGQRAIIQADAEILAIERGNPDDSVPF